jgi:hypothetical protein
MPHPPATRCRRITALLVPADDTDPVRLLQVEDRAQVFSEAIGGGLLDETAAELPDGQLVALYQDEDRHAVGLPSNARAAQLAAYLCLARRVPFGQLRGDLLVTGLDASRCDTNVPSVVLVAARRAGLMDRNR